MMLYPEGSRKFDDPRAKFPGVTWPHTREEVAQMTAFDAKNAGELGEKNMRKMGIDWVTFDRQANEVLVAWKRASITGSSSPRCVRSWNRIPK